MQAASDILAAVLDNLAQSTDVPCEELEARFERNLSQELSKSNLRTPDFRKDVRFLQFEGIISGQSSGPDDIEEDTEEMLDPWTRKVMVEPVRNMKCGHLYSSETVTRYLERSSQTSRRLHCPVPGCDNDNVRHSDLGWDVGVRL